VRNHEFLKMKLGNYRILDPVDSFLISVWGQSPQFFDKLCESKI